MTNPRITSRFKVYRTRIGFHDWIVAATSQKAALKAWDLHNQNLFATGAARVVNDPADVALALKTPGVPVVAPGQDKVRIPEAPARVLKKPRQAEAHAPAKQKAEPKPDRSKLDAAEEELDAFERETAQKRTALEKQRKALEDEVEDFEAAAAAQRKRLELRVEKERKALAAHR
jgi:hypothetical protein